MSVFSRLGFEKYSEMLTSFKKTFQELDLGSAKKLSEFCVAAHTAKQITPTLSMKRCLNPSVYKFKVDWLKEIWDRKFSEIFFYQLCNTIVKKYFLTLLYFLDVWDDFENVFIFSTKWSHSMPPNKILKMSDMFRFEIPKNCQVSSFSKNFQQKVTPNGD